MYSLFFYCALIGGALLVVQILLLVVGVDHGGDVDAGVGDVGDVGDVAHGMDGHVGHVDGDAATSTFFKMLSFKTAVAFLTFFGLTGLLGLRAKLPHSMTVVLAVAAGSLAFYFVAYLMGALAKLQSSGNIKLENAVGSTGRVYLRIPAKGAGFGKVTVKVQGRVIESKATTQGEELATGTEVKILKVNGPDVMEVCSVDEGGGHDQ
jgi:hypothetical protein